MECKQDPSGQLHCKGRRLSRVDRKTDHIAKGLQGCHVDSGKRERCG